MSEGERGEEEKSKEGEGEREVLMHRILTVSMPESLPNYIHM